MSLADTVSNTLSTETTVPTSSGPATVPDQLVLELTALRPWTRSSIGLFSRKRVKEVKVYADWIWRTSAEPPSRPTFDPSFVTQMQSVQTEFQKSVEKHFRKIYAKWTNRVWDLSDCLEEAKDAAMTEFQNDPRLEGISVETRIEWNDLVDGRHTSGTRWAPPRNGRPSYSDVGLGNLSRCTGSTAQSEGNTTIKTG